MAADLRRFESLGKESDAIRSLTSTRRYSYGDIARLVDDAMFAARQQILNREMRAS